MYATRTLGIGRSHARSASCLRKSTPAEDLTAVVARWARSRRPWCRNARSCSTDDHQFVAFGVGDRRTILRLVDELATGGDGRCDARLRDVRRNRELEVDAVALPAPLRLR